jgi:hypothetical protein
MQCFANLDLASFTWALSRAQRAPNFVRHNMVDRVLCLWAMEVAGEIASFSLEDLRRHADYWCRGPRAFRCFLSELVESGSLSAGVWYQSETSSASALEMAARRVSLCGAGLAVESGLYGHCQRG